MEIRHTDVRVGNIVRYSQSNAIRPSARGTIRYIKSRDIMDIEKYGDIFEPVALTPEILEKCEQLIADNYGVYFFKGSEICCKLTNEVLQIGMWNYENEDKQIPVICELKYTHQLQNCFYSLTQTELNIKL